jgi:excisionase family DNA binding protein
MTITIERARKDAAIARSEELLTVGEYALLVRCSEKTVYRRIWANDLPGAVRVGGQWRIDVALAAA